MGNRQHGTELMDDTTVVQAGTVAVLLVILGAFNAGVRGLAVAVGVVGVGALIVFW